MTFSTQSPDEVDVNLAINTAARHMTSAPHSPELRARVMSRIDAAQPRWHWGWRLAMAGGAIGAVAVATAITWKASPIETVSPVQSVAAIEPVATSTPHLADPTSSAVTSSPVASTASTRRAQTPRVIAVSDAELEWRARAVQALDLPEALHIAPLETSRLSIEPIDITPLSVAPLTVPAMGNGGSR